MRWSHFSIVLAHLFILANVGSVCAVGRGLRPPSHSSKNPSVVDQGPSPAQIEEQEEDDGIEQQELDAPQQENSLQILADIPAQSVVESPQMLKFSSSQEPAPAVVAAPVVAALSLASLQKPPAQALSLFSRPSERKEPTTIGGASASSLFSKVLPASMADPAVPGSTAAGSYLAGPKTSFEAVNNKKYSTCSPPCKQGRGVCNDNMCFCKSPFVGTTCQHKVGAYSRAPFPMMIGFAIVSFVMGGLGAQIVHAVSVRAVEGRTGWLHATGTKQEVWRPPGAGKTPVPRGHAVQEQKADNESGE